MGTAKVPAPPCDLVDHWDEEPLGQLDDEQIRERAERLHALVIQQCAQLVQLLADHPYLLQRVQTYATSLRQIGEIKLALLARARHWDTSEDFELWLDDLGPCTKITYHYADACLAPPPRLPRSHG
jgi:hypothetical protein